MNRRTIYKRALILAVPIMIQNGITNAVGLVDHIMVGSLGTEAMTAVSIVGQLLFVFALALFGGISGPGIFTAQYYGQGNTEGVRVTTRMKALIALAVTAVGIGVLAVGEEGLIRLYLSGESAVIDVGLTLSNAKDYMRIMLLGLPALAVTQIYSSTLRETGDSFKPMVAGIASVATDIVFNWLLIYGNLGFPQLGVKGAAIATVISRFVDAALLVIWVHARKKRHPFVEGLWRTVRVERELFVKMLKKTLPIMCNEFLWSAGLAAMTQCYSTRGLEVVAGVNISNVLCNLFNVVFVALGYSVGILVGQSLGAGEYERARKESAVLTRFTAAVCIGLGAALVAVSGVFPKLYDTTDEVRKLSSAFIMISAPFFPVQGVLNALYFTLRSGGKTLVTFAFDSVFSWTVSLPVTLILCLFTDMPIQFVFAIAQATDLIKVIIGAVMIRKGVWINNLAGDTDGTAEITEG